MTRWRRFVRFYREARFLGFPAIDAYFSARSRL